MAPNLSLCCLTWSLKDERFSLRSQLQPHQNVGIMAALLLDNVMGAVSNTQEQLEFRWHGGLWVSMAEWEWENRRDPCSAFGCFHSKYVIQNPTIACCTGLLALAGTPFQIPRGRQLWITQADIDFLFVMCQTQDWAHCKQDLTLFSKQLWRDRAIIILTKPMEKIKPSDNNLPKGTLQMADLRPDSEANSLNQYTVLVFNDWT